MSAALLVLVACCCCSSSSVGAYFALNKNAKYYEDKVDTLIDKVIESGAAIKDCKELRDFVIDNVEDIEKNKVKVPEKGTKKGDIFDTIMRWDDLKEMDKQMGRTKQEKLATLCDSKTGIDLISEVITKIKNKDTSVCPGRDESKMKSVPEFIWDEEIENFIKIDTYVQNEIKKNDVESTLKKICDPSYVPEIPYEDLSENAKNLISAIEKIYDGISPEKCTDLKEKWDKIIDGRSLDEIFERDEVKDPELYFIFSNPKYRGVLEIVSEINELIALRDDTSELPEGVTMVEMSDEEIINKFCISDLKRKIDEKVTLLKNEDISGCDLYDDTWHVIRKDWNNGLIWDNENNKILVAHNYVSKALGETNEDLKAGKRMVKETLCAPPSSPSPSQNIIDHGNGYIEITSS
jgi:hypothetical protein